MRKFLALVLIISLVGCTRVTYELADESRLPKWFTLTEGLSRKDVKVKLTYYVKPSGKYAVFEIESNNKSYAEKVEGTPREPYLIDIKGSQYSYEVITINGITEVVERRDKEPIFYLTENSAIIEQLTSD